MVTVTGLELPAGFSGICNNIGKLFFQLCVKAVAVTLQAAIQ